MVNQAVAVASTVGYPCSGAPASLARCRRKRPAAGLSKNPVVGGSAACANLGLRKVPGGKDMMLIWTNKNWIKPSSEFGQMGLQPQLIDVLKCMHEVFLK